MGRWVAACCGGAFWGGILLGDVVRPPRGVGLVVLLAGAALLVVGALVLSRIDTSATRSTGAAAIAAIVLSFAVLGWGREALRQIHTARSPLRSITGSSIRLEGALAGDTETGPFGWHAPLNARLVGVPDEAPRAWRVRDLVWLQGDGRAPALRRHDRISVEGVVRRTTGEFATFLARRGYTAVVSVERIDRSGASGNVLVRVTDAVRSALRRSSIRALGPRDAGLLMGLTIGDTSGLDPGVEQDFRATGLTHLLAVSGGNVAMFLAPVFALVATLSAGPLVRLCVGVISVSFFVLLTGAEPSVLRATAMSTLAMLGVFFGRPRSPPATIGAAVLLLLAWDPSLVHAIGFQLSVAATAGIALFAAPVADRLRFLPRPLSVAAGTALGAQAAVAPIILHYFRVVPTVAIPANLLAFPAVAPAMFLGFLSAVAEAVLRPVDSLLAPIARLPLLYLQAVARRMARIPLPSVTSGGPHFMRLVLGLALVALAGWWLRSGRRMPKRGLVLVGFLVVTFAWATAFRAGPPSELTVTFFDVGQGDAALIRSPAGASILIDGGPEPDVAAAKLAALGLSRIDVVVATHPHEDHVAGLRTVLSRFAVGVVLDAGCGGDAPSYDELLAEIEESDVPLRHPRFGDALRVGDLRIDVLGPRHCSHGSDADANNDSLVLRVTHAHGSVQFPGDAEEPAQEKILRDAPHLVPALVLKVPHHGGDTSLEEFFRAVGARIAVVSVGENRYGHPVSEVLSDLRRMGSRVVRTDRYGDVTVSFGEGSLTVTSNDR